MSDTTFFVGFGVLLVGLLYALFVIDHLVYKLGQLKENLELTRHRVSFLEKLHMVKGGE